METIVALAGITGAAVLGVTWIAYPALVWLLSAVVRRRPVRGEAQPLVSVVLATRDEAKQVRRRVRNLCRTRYPAERLEVVVALDADGSTTPAELGHLSFEPDLQVVPVPERGGKAVALNAGVEAARGEILVFTDTHQRFTRDTIPELVAGISDPEIAGASGSLRLRRRQEGLSVVDLYWRFERWLRRREALIHSPVGVTGAVSALRASLWKPLPPGLILDDVYTPMRLVMEGYRFAFVEDAVAYETRRPAPVREHARKARTLTGNLQLCAWLPGLLLPWENPLFPQFLFHKLFRLLTPYAVLMLLFWGASTLATSRPVLLFFSTAVAGLGLVWVWRSRTGVGSRVRSVLLELVLTQVAVVQATVNGLRGQWEVWR